MKKTKPKKLLTVLLTLYLALSIVPITVFADSGSYAVKFYPGDYGTMTKNDQIPFVYYGFDDDVNKPYYYKLNVSETETLSFASSIINVLLPNSDYEFAYWKADATVYQVGSGTAIPAGTALSSDQLQNKITVKSDVTFTAHFKQISEYPDDSVITSAAVQNVKFNYQPGDAPQATAEVYNADADKYEIAYECWEEMENGEPVAFWYSDESKYTPSMKKITQFEEGKTYMYSIELREKNGYTFADNCSVTINGNPISATANAVKTVDGLFIMNVETICPEVTKEISVIEINNATLTFKDGDKPVFTGTVPENDQYAFRCEWWNLDENTGIVSTEPEWGGDIYKNKITAFEAGKTYHYGVYVTAYTADISPDAKLKINGRKVKYTRIGDESDTQSFWVETDLTMTPAADGHTHNYGTEWKYDETNHWHECECGNKADITAHTFKQIIDKEATATEKGSKHEECTVCGYKKAAVDIPKIDSHNHDYGTEWKYDSTNHWHKCECGNKADITAHTFKQIIDKEATATEKGSKHEECTVCGYKKAAVDIPVTDFGNSSDDQPNKPINTASSESSSADQTNKPINTASPKTGNTDNMILWIVLLIAGGGAFITATAADRKKK